MKFSLKKIGALSLAALILTGCNSTGNNTSSNTGGNTGGGQTST